MLNISQILTSYMTRFFTKFGLGSYQPVCAEIRNYKKYLITNEKDCLLGVDHGRSES